MLYVRFWNDGKLRAQAQIDVGRVVGFADGDARVAAVLRRCTRLVIMSYTQSCLQVVFNQPEIANMQNLLDALRVKHVKTPDEKDLKRVFVAPRVESPDDGRFNYVVVKTLPELCKGFEDAEPNTVLLLDLDPAVLAFLSEESSAFLAQPVLITGIPKADYTPAFEMRMYGFPKSSYADLLEQLAANDADDEIRARADRSEAGRSARRGTRFEDGGGRFNKFNVATFEPVGAANAINGRSRPVEDEDVGATDDRS